MLILGPKWLFFNFMHDKNFFKKIQNSHFYLLFNVCHKVHFQKISFKQIFFKKSKHFNFVPKNSLFTQFWAAKESSLKKRPPQLSCIYSALTSAELEVPKISNK